MSESKKELRKTEHQSGADQALEKLVTEGDLSKLGARERVEYYRGLCESLGLNHLTRPFEYMQLSGKLTLYAKKDCAEQLRKKNKISISLGDGREVNGVWLIKATATDRDGRTDEATGAVSLTNSGGARLRGDALANAVLKAETKAKRRVTLSISGLGMLDESEAETVPGAKPAPKDVESAPADNRKSEAREKLQTQKPAESQPPASDGKLYGPAAVSAVAKVKGWTRDQLTEYARIVYGAESARQMNDQQCQEMAQAIQRETYDEWQGRQGEAVPEQDESGPWGEQRVSSRIGQQDLGME